MNKVPESSICRLHFITAQVDLEKINSCMNFAGKTFTKSDT